MSKPFYCIFSDTLHREHHDQEYFESIILSTPVYMTGMKVISRGAPVPQKPEERGKTEPAQFGIDVFALDIKADEPERLILIGSADFTSDQTHLDVKLKGMFTNNVFIRGHYKFLTLNLYGESPKFQKREEDDKPKESRSQMVKKKDSSDEDDDDDMYDDWAYVKNVRDIHSDKIYPITLDSDLPLSDSDEEQEPRMALPLAPPTLPDEIKERAKDEDDPDSIEIDPKVKAELESAPPVNERIRELPIKPPTELIPIHLKQIQKATDLNDLSNSMDDGKSNEKINERSLARLSAILKDLKPGSETVRKVTLLEEACDCVLPWLSEVDLDLSRKLIKEVRRTLAQNYSNTELPPAATVRLLKSGLRLVTLISTVSEELTGIILSEGILQKLFYLLSLSHFASSLRIMALHGVDQIISWPNGMKSFLRFNDGSDGGIPGSGYEHLVQLIIKKPTIRVAYSAGQILAKVDVGETTKQLRNIVLELLKKSPFHEFNTEDDISLPKTHAENRDSDTETTEPKSEAKLFNEIKNVSMEEVNHYDSSLIQIETVKTIVELLKRLTEVVKEPSSISQISAKELPNRKSKKTGVKGRIFLSRLFDNEEIIKVCLGILHVPYLAAHLPVFSALSDFLIQFTSSKGGILLFAAHCKPANLIIQSLLSASFPASMGDEKFEIHEVLPVDLAAILAIRLQTVGLLDDLLCKNESKWANQHWSALQGLCALFSHSDSLSTFAADICSDHSILALNIMRDNGPSSSQAAEFLHTIIEHCSHVDWLEDLMSDINQIMEQDNLISEVLSKLFSGQIQFNIQNSLLTMKKLSESLEYGVSLELIHGPGLSFHTRIFESLLSSDNSVMTAIGNGAFEVLTANLNAISKCITFNSIANQPLGLRAHVQTKQIIMSTLRSIDRILSAITAVGYSYPDSKLCKAVLDVYCKIWTIVDIGEDLMETTTRLVINLLFKYLYNPKKTKDLNTSAWFILLENLSESLISQPANAIPIMTLLMRLLPNSAADPYVGLWRLYLKHGTSGETIIESVISFSHSSHVDLSQMAFDIIVQFCMIDPTLAGSIVTRIQQHFAPILPTENGDNAKVEKPEKKYEVWNWQRSCQLVNIIIGDKMLSDEQCHHFVESLLHKLTSTAKEPNAHSEPIQSIVRLIYRLIELRKLGNNEFLAIITATTDLIKQAKQMSLENMGSIIWLCAVTTRKTNSEVLKIVREKLVRADLIEFVKNFATKVNGDSKHTSFDIFFDFYEFLRTLESVLEKSDIKPIFNGDENPFKEFSVFWTSFMKDVSDEDQNLLEEIDSYFVSLANHYRFEDESNITSPEINGVCEENGEIENILKNRLSELILYPRIISHSNKSEKQLVTTCEFVEFSRDMINLKIEEDMEKVLMEPEMTCLAEEDAKHEAFSTRIGRSFTFQKRSHFENENFRNSNRGGSRSTNRGNSSYGRARTVYRKPTRESSGVTRPAAMHVDDYQKAEEADSDHEKGDGYERHSPRYRDRSPPSSRDHYRDRSPPRRGGYRGSDRGRGFRGSPGGRGRGSFRGSRGGGGRGMTRY